jgi:hypothetical protein
MLAVHHIAFDEWSQEVLCTDLSHAYLARLEQERPWADRPAPTLAQVVTEYRRQLLHTDSDAQREYWRSALRGLPRLAVPEMAGTPADASVALSWEITAAELAVWDKAAHAYGTTRFAVLLAAYADALLRVTGQPDLAVGTPVARRGGRILEHALTCLIDTVCIRLRPGLAADAESLITQAQHAAGEALAAADVPFGEVVELVNPARDGTTNPLYQAMFSLHDDEPDLRLAGCTAEFRRAEAAGATVDLVTGVWPNNGGGCSIRVAHRTDRVPATVARAIGEMVTAILRGGPTSLCARQFGGADAIHPAVATPER